MNDECSVMHLFSSGDQQQSPDHDNDNWIAINYYLNSYYLPQIRFICQAHLRLMISWMQITLLTDRPNVWVNISAVMFDSNIKLQNHKPFIHSELLRFWFNRISFENNIIWTLGLGCIHLRYCNRNPMIYSQAQLRSPFLHEWRFSLKILFSFNEKS